MKNDVYILEYNKETSILSNLMKSITGEDYNHTAMIIGPYLCELNPLEKLPNEEDYRMRAISCIADFLKVEDRCEAYKVPYKFTNDQMQTMLEFWVEKIKKKEKYGYAKLLVIFFVKAFVKFAKKYYQKKGKVLPIKSLLLKLNACSNAVDICLKKGGYDILKDLPEEITYPGLFARELKDYKVI